MESFSYCIHFKKVCCYIAISPHQGSGQADPEDLEMYYLLHFRWESESVKSGLQSLRGHLKQTPPRHPLDNDSKMHLASSNHRSHPGQCVSIDALRAG